MSPSHPESSTHLSPDGIQTGKSFRHFFGRLVPFTRRSDNSTDKLIELSLINCEEFKLPHFDIPFSIPNFVEFGSALSGDVVGN